MQVSRASGMVCAVAEWLRRSNLTTVNGPATARTRLTQPATLSGTSNRVAASAGVMPDGR